MPSIKIAANYIAATDTILAGSLRNSGHLQIVFDDDNPDTRLIEAEVQAPTLVFAGDWDFQPFGQLHGEPTDYIAADDTIENTNRYDITTASLRSYQTAENVWNMLRSVHNALEVAAPGLDYDIGQNSNSYVRTALYTVGIDLGDHLAAATPPDVTQFPGAGKNVLLGSEQGISSDVPIDLNLSGANSGTAGDDFIRTGIGNDTIEGGGGNDTIEAGDGNDTLNGGIGNDTYNIAQSGNGTDTITDEDGQGLIVITNNDVNQSLFSITGDAKSIEGGENGKQLYEIENNNIKLEYDPATKILNINGWDGKGADDKIIINDFDNGELGINLAQGTQDLIFAVDVSGSMGDDIAAVKSRVGEILNVIFSGTQNSRVGIITFNDTGSINTVLNFTDDPIAAQSGINSLSILGGGQEPLNGALLHALNGGAGLWRAGEEVDRRIIVFSDEPPADPEKAAQVATTSANVGAVIEQNNLPLVVSQALALTQNAVPNSAVPVDIFTVAIGNSSSTISALAEIAANNRGQAFTAANANELVAALISAITVPNTNELPIAQNDSATTQQELAVNIAILSNDSDPDGDILAIDSFTQGSNGLVTLSDNGTPANTADDSIVYTPTPQSDPTIGFSDSFEYTISDGNGGTATASVSVAVGKIENSGNGKDPLMGTPGDDVLHGGNGKDILVGLSGNDVLSGGNGKDILIGGLGNDNLTGGKGNDTFGIAAGDGADLITDFKQGNDNIGLIGDLGSNVSSQISNGETLVSNNGELLVRLIGEYTLTEADFIPLAIS